MLKKILASALAAVLVAGGLTTLSLTSAPAPAQALSGAEFDPGNIISDSTFFNGSAMSEGQVQAFLDSYIGSCRNANCLNVKRLDTASRPADQMCGAYAGAAGERVSRILAKVSQACGINPQVLLVTLQKEQSLVTGDIARGPSDARLERAMGYACPDTANGGCDPSFGGVYNQLYKAAWQFKRYANPAGTSNFFTWFRPGTTAAVQYSPNAACGTRPVTIRNQATANLYYYTPYTPNGAALTNLRGTGDACSAYGNRNFWVYFNDWFGSPTAPAQPIGSFEFASGGVGTVTVAGWALDRSSTASIPVHVYVGPASTAIPTNLPRPDVGRAYPGSGDAHGFSSTVAASPGSWQVCLYALGVVSGNNSMLGCKSVTVRDPSPVGSVEAVRPAPGGIQVAGWATDFDTPDPIPVHVYVDGVGRAVTADLPRSDIGRLYPEQGPGHGFASTFAAAPGRHEVCVYGINAGPRGTNRLFQCSTVVVPPHEPIGAVDGITASAGVITLSGWALDGDVADAIPVHVYVDGVGKAYTADLARSDIGRLYPAYGAGHGFAVSVPASQGSHEVCVYAINRGPGSNSLLTCRTVVVANTPPVGNVEVVRGVPGGVQVAGWAFDPDQPRSPLAVHVYVGGAGRAVTADLARSDIGRIYPEAGPAHGFAAVVPASSGRQDVCVYALDPVGGYNPVLTCTTVTVP